MADERIEQYPDVPTFKEQGVDWTFTAWRGICLPRGCPPEIRDRLAVALEKVAQSDEFNNFMDDAGFDVTWQPPDEFAATMAGVDKQLGKLLTSEAMLSMQQSRFGPMFFPGVLACLGGVCFLGLVASGQLKRTGETEPLSFRDAGRLAEIGLWVVMYLVLAETVGFVLTAGLLLVLLLVRLGNRWLTSTAISAMVVVVTYQLFAVVLKCRCLAAGWDGEMSEAALQALSSVLGSPQVLLIIIAAAAYGVFMGAVPGLTATMAVALFVPVTFFMDPIPALAAVVTLEACAIFAGDIPNTLLRIPGTPSSAAYADDAYTLTKAVVLRRRWASASFSVWRAGCSARSFSCCSPRNWQTSPRGSPWPSISGCTCSG